MCENKKRTPNDVALDGCEGSHNFQPILDDDNSSSLYRCLKCDGVVESIVGLRYILTGSF